MIKTITDLMAGLAERYSEALGPESDKLRQYVKDHKVSTGDDGRYILGLFERRAGLLPRDDDGAEQRLNNPRLLTIYPMQRKRAFAASVLKHADTIVSLIGPLMQAVVGLELAKEEFEIERDREHALRKATALHKRSGLYPAVAAKVNVLFQRYKVDHWAWAAVRDEDLRVIAAILLRRPVDELPPAHDDDGREG